MKSTNGSRDTPDYIRIIKDMDLGNMGNKRNIAGSEEGVPITPFAIQHAKANHRVKEIEHWRRTERVNQEMLNLQRQSTQATQESLALQKQGPSDKSPQLWLVILVIVVTWWTISKLLPAKDSVMLTVVLAAIFKYFDLMQKVLAVSTVLRSYAHLFSATKETFVSPV